MLSRTTSGRITFLIFLYDIFSSVSHVARETNGGIIVEISAHLEVRFGALIFPLVVAA